MRRAKQSCYGFRLGFAFGDDFRLRFALGVYPPLFFKRVCKLLNW